MEYWRNVLGIILNGILEEHARNYLDWNIGGIC